MLRLSRLPVLEPGPIELRLPLVLRPSEEIVLLRGIAALVDAEREIAVEEGEEVNGEVTDAAEDFLDVIGGFIGTVGGASANSSCHCR